jgi:aspartyl-tRNA(Asn)/glutamyl-tRNA(Gln) amidotransferase subunit C
MKLTKKDVEYVSNLARLELSAQEADKFTGQLESILKYMEQLNKLDTSNVKPTTNVIGLKNVFREDVVVNCSYDERERILENAPKREGDFFKVKKVIEQQ